jgi:hypothetical protein
MFSWDCDHCGHPLICHLNIQENNAWMHDAVALLPNGSMLMGEYDGYGRVAGAEIHLDGEPQVFHKICWEKVGKPTKFEKSSRSAADQGHFYGDHEHNSPPPGSLGHFHADEKRPKAFCPSCNTSGARQVDAFHFVCGNCSLRFVPGGDDDRGGDSEAQGEDRPDES